MNLVKKAPDFSAMTKSHAFSKHMCVMERTIVQMAVMKPRAVVSEPLSCE